MNLLIEVVSIVDEKPISINVLEIEDVVKNRGCDDKFNEYIGVGHKSEYPYCTIITKSQIIYSVDDSRTVWFKIRTAIEEQTKRI